MASEERTTVEFADALLAAFGLPSITVEDKPQSSGANRPPASLGTTGIHGREILSAQNRDALVRALGGAAKPTTVSELSASLRALVDRENHRGAAAILGAIEKAAERSPDASLEDLARG